MLHRLLSRTFVVFLLTFSLFATAAEYTTNYDLTADSRLVLAQRPAEQSGFFNTPVGELYEYEGVQYEILNHDADADEFEQFIRQEHQEGRRMEGIVLQSIDGETVIPLDANLRKNILAWHEKTGHETYTQEEIQQFLRFFQTALEYGMLEDPIEGEDDCYAGCLEISMNDCDPDKTGFVAAAGGAAGAWIGSAVPGYGTSTGGLMGWYMGHELACKIPSALGCHITCPGTVPIPHPSCGSGPCYLTDCPPNMRASGSCLVGGGGIDQQRGTCCVERSDVDPNL